MTDVSSETSGPKYADVFVQLSGADSNAGAIIGRVAEELRSYGVASAEVNEFRMACMSGSYDDLLRTVCAWVTTA